MRGVDPEAVVVSFATGPPTLTEPMCREVHELIPGRRHFRVGLEDLQPGGAWSLYRQLRRRFGRFRIGMAPVLLHAGNEYRPLRLAAFLLAPRKILAYNARLERHHLQLRTCVGSWLFWRGVALDRIYLRPWWLWPWRRDRTTAPGRYRILEGRPPASTRAKAAVLTPFFPYPLSHGGAVRIFHLLREAALDYDITLFSFVEQESEDDLRPLLALCARLVLVPKPRYREPRWSSWNPPEVEEYRSAVMARLIKEHTPGLLQVEYTQLAGYGGQILVEHDLTFDLYRQVHQRKRTISSWWDWWRWQRYERRTLAGTPVAVVMSEKDAALSGHSRVVVIPNGVDLQRFTPASERHGQRVLFVGSFRHFPNVGAVRFLIEEVWPRLRAMVPDAELTVVAGPDPQLHWSAATGQRDFPGGESVRVLGFVADVKPLYEEANVVVVSTLVSAGTNLKVLEAMAMSRAIVSTSNGCAGIGLEPGRAVWIADDAESFASAIATLLGDAALRNRLGQAARELALSRYSWRRLGRLQRDLWADLVPCPLRIRPGEELDIAAMAAIQEAAPEAARWAPAEYLRYDVIVAEFDGTVTGFAVSRQTGPGEREILNLAVAPGWRRQGVASRLLAAVLEHNDAKLFLEVRESNLVARKLYKNFGFEVTARRLAYYANPSETGIVMEWRKC
jgi:ribosomal protein S18 acetylase RimI-like enzyme